MEEVTNMIAEKLAELFPDIVADDEDSLTFNYDGKLYGLDLSVILEEPFELPS